MFRFLCHPLKDTPNPNITQRWGENREQYASLGYQYGHPGIDYSCTVGTPVYAPLPGRIVTGNEANGFGLYVKVQFDFTDATGRRYQGEVLLAHLNKQTVKTGDVVNYGQKVGESGNTGLSTGPHLHLGIRVSPWSMNDGAYGFQNPAPFFDGLRLPFGPRIDGWHWIPVHRDANDDDAMRRQQPSVVKVIDMQNNYQFLEMVFKDCPNALIVLRDHPLSEQHSDVARDPVGTGKRHAQEWKSKLNAIAQNCPSFSWDRVLVLGINEPQVWDMLAQVVEYTKAFAEEAEKLGVRIGALNLSVGWPSNGGVPDAPSDWKPYEPAYFPVKRGGHYLFVHEYFAVQNKKPNYNQPWWIGRIAHCPWVVPIGIGEHGCDNYVLGSYDSTRGWQGNCNSEEYMAMLEYCDRLYASDLRVFSVMPYTYDYGSNDWESFSVRTQSIRESIISYVTRNRTTTPPDVPVAPVAKFAVGETVEVTGDTLNVRSTPSKNGTVLGTQRKGDRGVIIAGPTYADNYEWYQIDYQKAPDGWSAATYLEEYDEEAPPPTEPEPTPPPTTTVPTIIGEVVSERPNNGTSYVSVKAFNKEDEIVGGIGLAFAWRDSANPAAKYTTKAGVATDMPLYVDGKTPCAGEWDVWLFDEARGLVSERVQFHTDGPGGHVNEVHVEFRWKNIPTTPTPPDGDANARIAALEEEVARLQAELSGISIAWNTLE